MDTHNITGPYGSFLDSIRAICTYLNIHKIGGESGYMHLGALSVITG
jgi:hypothetical protein